LLCSQKQRIEAGRPLWQDEPRFIDFALRSFLTEEHEIFDYTK
jgi:hypothetical protein